MAQKKKPVKKTEKAQTKTTTSGRKEKKKKEERRKKVLRTLGGIFAYLLFTIIMFLSFYSDLLSTFGEFIKNVFLGVFGKTSFAFPFALIYGILYIKCNIPCNEYNI